MTLPQAWEAISVLSSNKPATYREIKKLSEYMRTHKDEAAQIMRLESYRVWAVRNADKIKKWAENKK